jgi:hypothetical protein
LPPGRQHAPPPRAEAPAKGGQPVWRRDGEAGLAWTLIVTDAGLDAFGVEPTGYTAAPLPKRAADRGGSSEAAASEPGESTGSGGASRPDTKQSRLIAVLSADGGCSIGEAAAAFGWLPHTTRAALTGLRRKGYVIERMKGEAGAASRHRIVATAPVA